MRLDFPRVNFHLGVHARREYGRRASVRLDGLSIVRGGKRQRAPVRQRDGRVGPLLAREPLPAAEGEALAFSKRRSNGPQLDFLLRSSCGSPMQLLH